MRKTKLAAFVAASLACLLSCRTADHNASQPQEIGGTIFNEFIDANNCDVLVYLIKNLEKPLKSSSQEFEDLGCHEKGALLTYEQAMEQRAGASKLAPPVIRRVDPREPGYPIPSIYPQPIFRLAGGDNDATPSSSSFDRALDEYSPESDELKVFGDQRRCKELKVYHDTQMKLFVEYLVFAKQKSCDIHYYRDDIVIYDHPTCGRRHVCSDDFSKANDLNCYTCKHPKFSMSTITCQTQEAAKDAVLLWCELHNNCDDAKPRDSLECRTAEPSDAAYTRSASKLSGVANWTTSSAQVGFFFKAYAGGRIGSNKAKGELNFAIDAKAAMQIINYSDYPTWVKRGERYEGGEKTVYNCSLEVVGSVIFSGELGKEYGMTIADQGANAGFSVGIAGGLVGTKQLVSRALSASGLTQTQILERCKMDVLKMGENSLKELIENYGTITKEYQSESKPCSEHKDCRFTSEGWDSNYAWNGYGVRLCDRAFSTNTAKTTDETSTADEVKGVTSADGLASNVIGRCRMFASYQDHCRRYDSYPCRPGTTCTLTSQKNFLGYTWDKQFECRTDKKP